MGDSEKHDDEKVGEIKIIQEPYAMKGNKYVVDIRAFDPIESPIEDGGIPNSLLPDFTVTSQLEFATVEQWRPIKRLSGRLGVVMEMLDKQEGKKFWHYRAYVSSPEGEHYEADDIADHLKEALEGLGAKIQIVEEWKISKFPWEQPKVTARVPITRKMFNEMIEKMRRKKNEVAKSAVTGNEKK